jgi:hypothetical protein
MCAPAKNGLHVLDLLFWTGQAREKLLTVEQFRRELVGIVVRSLEHSHAIYESQNVLRRTSRSLLVCGLSRSFSGPNLFR